jgi:hypothetical protein
VPQGFSLSLRWLGILAHALLLGGTHEIGDVFLGAYLDQGAEHSAFRFLV